MQSSTNFSEHLLPDSNVQKAFINPAFCTSILIIIQFCNLLLKTTDCWKRKSTTGGPKSAMTDRKPDVLHLYTNHFDVLDLAYETVNKPSP